MILTKHKIDQVDIDFLVNSKLNERRINEVLFIVPTKRKIRYLTRDLISLSPGNSLSGLKIETIGSFAEKMISEIAGDVKQVSEQAAILLLNHNFKKSKLKYFSQYRDQIPFGTLERVKNVISEYKRHGISPDRLNTEADNLSGGEKLKASDIAAVYDDYQKTLQKNNLMEAGDVYASLNKTQKINFDDAFYFNYSGCKFILVNGFDEFTAPEVEIINSASIVDDVELYVILDYYKYNPLIFSHLNTCHDNLIAKGFKEIKDNSPATQSKFLNTVRENLSIRTSEHQKRNLKDSISCISSLNREEEVEIIAREIKKLLVIEKVEPEKICVVFNLIGNYSSIIRDRFNVFGIPFNLTDRFSLSTSPPVKALVSFLEILEKDFYFKNIFRSLSSAFFGRLQVDVSNLLKISADLKIVSGFETWINKINAKISDMASSNDPSINSDKKIKNYKSALSGLEKIYNRLKPFASKLSPSEFRENILSLIFNLDFPVSLLNAPSEVVEYDTIAFNSFVKLIDEISGLIELEYGREEKFSLHFYLNQIRTTAAFTRYNISEKPGYGVQVTTLNEIRGLSFDYLFIGGLNDGDLPTRFTPEIFFSGPFVREEFRHQVEQRYLFYQALCVWKKKLYLSYPQTDGKRELVQSSFLQDFNTLFESRMINSEDFKNEIYSKEELLQLIGTLREEERTKLNLADEIALDIPSINDEINIDRKRFDDPFGESEYTGFISPETNEEVHKKLTEVTEDEFSATQLENYAKCPYKYFVENILKLETLVEPVEELEAFEYGSLIHSILYEFYSAIKEKGIVLFNCSDKEFEISQKLLFKIAENRFDKLLLNPEVSFYEREKLLGINGVKRESILYKFLEEERKNDGGYVPDFFEMSFGNVRKEKGSQEKSSEAISTGKIKLRGKIDRIDMNRDEKVLKVVDYKLGGTKPTAEELSTGISLQLPLYLFAAKELIKRELKSEYRPAGAQIFSLKFNEGDFGKKNISLKSRRSKTDNLKDEIDAAEEMIKICLEMVDKFIEDISKGKFHLSTLPNREAKVCRFCDFKRICRIQEVD